MARYNRIHAISDDVKATLLAEDETLNPKEIHAIFHDLEKNVVRSRILQ